MKTILLSLGLFLPMLSFAQIFDCLPKDEDGRIYFSEVIHVDSISKNQLYLNSKKFFVAVLKSNIDTILVDDKEAAIIIARCFFDIYGLSNTGFAMINQVDRITQMVYTLKIQSREGRYKYEIFNISFKNMSMKVPKVTSAEDYFDFSKETDTTEPKSKWDRTYTKTPAEAAFHIKWDRWYSQNGMVDNIQRLVVLIKYSMSKSGLLSDNNDNW
jgi:hypothetical protein